MAKVHITLVGGQPAPVYNGIVATAPEKVVYIYSTSSVRALNALKNELDIPSSELELDVTSPRKIKVEVEKLAEKYKNDEVTVNISSGLKSWAFWFSVVFHGYANASVVYIDQNNVLWNYRTMESSDDFVFDMHTLFRLYGNPLENNYKKFTDYTKEDFEVIDLIEKIRSLNITDFNKLTTVLSNEQKHQVRNSKIGCFTCGESFVEWDKNNHSVKVGISKSGRIIEKVLNSPHVVDLIFNAGWFELKVAKLISGWKHAKEICLNCRFPFKENMDKNEVDILVNTGVKILFVECKTQINTTTDIDKFRSVVKGYGGIGSKGLFVTNEPMKELAITKCNDHGIITFSVKGEHFLGMETDQALYWKLDNELLNINVK